MKRSRRPSTPSGAWTWLVVALAAGCGGNHAVHSDSASAGRLPWQEPAADPAVVAAASPYAAPGERMAYRLSIHRVEVAAFTIAVGDVQDIAGRRALVVEAGVQSTGIAALVKKVRTEFASWVDARTGRPVMSRVVETAGVDDPSIETSEARYHAIHDGVLPIAMTGSDGSETVEDQRVAGAEVWDVPSILLYFRGWKAPVGTELATEVVRSRYIWRCRFKVAARETVVTRLGQLPAVRIDGVARRVLRTGKWEPKGEVRNFSVWISDDADRVPVLIVGHSEYGDVRMEIVDYRAGAGPNLTATGGRTAP